RDIGQVTDIQGLAGTCKSADTSTRAPPASAGAHPASGTADAQAAPVTSGARILVPERQAIRSPERQAIRSVTTRPAAGAVGAAGLARWARAHQRRNRVRPEPSGKIRSPRTNPQWHPDGASPGCGMGYWVVVCLGRIATAMRYSLSAGGPCGSP